MIVSRLRSSLLHSPQIIPNARFSNLTRFKEMNQLAKMQVAKTYDYVTSNILTAAFSGLMSWNYGFANVVGETMAAHHPLISCLGAVAVCVIPLKITMMIDGKENPVLKKSALTVSNVVLGTMFSPIGAVGADVILPAVVMTSGLSGALAIASKSAVSDLALKYENPIKAAVGAVASAGLCSLVCSGTTETLLHGISYYGGFGVFSALMVLDLRQIHDEAGEVGYCAIDRSILVALDVGSLFARCVKFLEEWAKEKELFSVKPDKQDSLDKIIDDKIREDRKYTGIGGDSNHSSGNEKTYHLDVDDGVGEGGGFGGGGDGDDPDW